MDATSIMTDASIEDKLNEAITILKENGYYVFTEKEIRELVGIAINK